MSNYDELINAGCTPDEAKEIARLIDENHYITLEGCISMIHYGTAQITLNLDNTYRDVINKMQEKERINLLLGKWSLPIEIDPSLPPDKWHFKRSDNTD